MCLTTGAVNKDKKEKESYADNNFHDISRLF